MYTPTVPDSVRGLLVDLPKPNPWRNYARSTSTLPYHFCEFLPSGTACEQRERICASEFVRGVENCSILSLPTTKFISACFAIWSLFLWEEALFYYIILKINIILP